MVSCDVVWRALRLAEVWIVDVINSKYAGATTAVQFKHGTSQEFEVKVGVHQGSVLNPLLFIIVTETLASNQVQARFPMELLYADDLVLLAESEEEFKVKIASWMKGMKERDFE
jgi:Reverse transcriptase (RNA-dependent DNA polymerase)